MAEFANQKSPADDPAANPAEADPPPRSDDQKLPGARLTKTPWRGWVWSVPLAALILVGFLAVRTWVLSGPTVTLTFPVVHGLNPAGTSVFYKGVQVGTVESVKLTDRDRWVAVTLSMDSSVSGLLRTGTQFWINQPNLLGGNLGRLVSGPVIEMLPGKGARARRFKGLLHRPDLVPDQPGKIFVIRATRLGNLHRGSRVLYHGLTAGELTGWSYHAADNKITLKAFIRAPFDRRVNGGVRFWRQGSLGVSTRGGGVKFNIPPLGSILQGALAFASGPDKAPAPTPRVFQLYSSRSKALHALTGPAAVFSAELRGSVTSLREGAPVVLKGMRVGRVRTVGLKFDAKQRRMVVPVTFDVYANKLGIASTGRSTRQASAELVRRMAELVGNGLRARLDSSSLFLGGEEIALVMVGSPGQKRLDVSMRPPAIPAVGGGGLSGIIASVRTITHHVNSIPLAAIGRNLRRLSARLNALAASPQLRKSIARLDKTLANTESITGHARGKITPAIASLRKAAQAAAIMAKTVTRVVGGGPATQQDVQHLVSELTETARAVRRLANFINRHPGALLHGRSK